MNLVEAKQLLSKNGFLVERINTRGLYLCFYLYGDRAHSRPECMEIKCATRKKEEVIDTLVSFFNYGPDDISYMVVAKVDWNSVNLYKSLIGQNIADDETMCNRLFRYMRGTRGVDFVEYNGTDFMEVWEECMGDTDDMSDEEYGERQDAANAECTEIIRQKITEELSDF